MKIGKFKKILVAGLVCALSFGLINSTKMVNAEDNGSSETIERIDNSNVNTSKTVSYNTNGTYDITLESFITGEVQQGEPIPTDIVLVLDVSGSMGTDDFPVGEPEEEYNKIYNNTNTNAYENRNNLYIKNENGEYKKVTVIRSGNYNNRTYYYSAEGYAEASSDETWIPEPYFGNLYVRSETTETITRLSALKKAVNSFIEATAAANAQISDSNKQHRISLVKFAGTKTSTIGNNTYQDGWNRYNYTQIVKNLTTVNASGATELKISVDSLSAAGATSADYGLEHAQTVLQNSAEGRNKVVIMFTDGEPNHGNGFDNNVAVSTITNAKKLKDDNVKVYTIGTLDGLDPSDNSSNMNKYMHATSSNFPNATANNNYGSFNVDFGSGNITSGYYKVATDSDSLNNIFEEISDDISVPSIDLDSSTILMDQLSDYFEFPDGFSKDDVEVYTAECKRITGTSPNKVYEWNDSVRNTSLDVTVDDNNKKVSVSGFDYKENFVGFDSDQTTVRGSKLIVKFSVKPIDGFIGGNGVPTNDPSSGIYDKNNSIVEHFVRPTTDVALNYHFKTNDTGIYITDDWKNFEFLVDEFNYKITNNSETEYSLSDDLVNDFVDVVYTVKDGEETIGTLTVPAGTDDLKDCNWTPKDGFTTAGLLDEDEKEYTIEVSVIPTKDKSLINLPSDNVQNDPNDDKSAKLYIFKPTVESHDIKNDMLLGSTVSNLDNQITDTGPWTCNTKDPNINTNIIHKNSIRPELTFKVTPCDQETVNEYTPTKIGYQEMEYTVHGHNGIDITTNTTAIHDNILKQCPLEEGNNCSEKHFYMNVVGGTITIDKVLNLRNGNLQVDESDGTPIFTFKIDKVNGDVVLKSYYKTVELSKVGDEWKLTEPIQISGLDVGTYKVTELSSMRYEFESVEVDNVDYSADGQTVSLNSTKKNATYEYTNKVKSTEYDSDNGYLINKVVKNEDDSYSMIASENSDKE